MTLTTSKGPSRTATDAAGRRQAPQGQPPRRPGARHGEGLDANGISVGMGFIGKAFSESKLLGYAFAYEQATRARVVPELTPPL